MAVPASVSLLLTNFRNKTTPGVYKFFTRRDVIAKQIQDRVNDPGIINQGLSSLCGPAAFLYCVAKKSPLVYAQYIVDLYDNGKAKLGSLKIEPSADNKAYDLPVTAGVALADWIGLAGLRDSANDFFDYQHYTSAIAGITMPGELLSWFTKAGYTSGENNTNIMMGAKNLSNLLSAHQKQQAGHAVCLFVAGFK